jgi:hypothetical protein
MFGLFKKKQLDENDVVIAAAKIVQDFADLIASGRISPALIYDVWMLPHTKSLIENSCKLSIKVCQDSYQRQCCKGVLVMLPQFQEGVGSTPLGIDATALKAMQDGGASMEEIEMRVTTMKMPSPELLEKVQAEGIALLEWTRQVVDDRP